MRKKKSAYLKPYIRRAKGKDFHGSRASSFRTAIRMGLYQNEPKAYVLVQRGSNKIIEIDSCRENLKYRIAVCYGKSRNRKFNKWCNDVKHYARGE